MAEVSKSKKTRTLANAHDQVTAYDHLLYLLFQFEQTLERGDVKWTAARLKRIQARLDGIALRVGRASDSGA